MSLSSLVYTKKRKSSSLATSRFSFNVFDSVAKINVSHWNNVAENNSEFLSLNYLKVIETVPPENMGFHYCIIYEAQKPVAIAYFQVIEFSLSNYESVIKEEIVDDVCLLSGNFRRHILSHLKKHVNQLNIRFLVCGNSMVSGEHGLAFLSDVNKSEIFEVLSDVIYQIGKVEKSKGKIGALVFKDFYEENKSVSSGLKDYKYYDFLVEPNMIVDIHWNTFEDYLAAMNKKYRSRAKTVIRTGIKLEQRDFTANDIIANKTKLQELHNNVYLKASFRLAAMSMEYFAEMKNILGDKFVFTAYYFEDKIVGFKSSFVLKSSIEAHYIGLDYDVNKELDLYQNILYDYVKQAINYKVKRLSLGRTASEIKSTVGAEAHPLTCYIRHRNPISNHIIKPIIDNLKPSEWIPRNPFKDNSNLELG